ncbi:fibronectin type III domain-containing protein [Enterococcus faecium]|nr:fibronectin type III domain-containing protein [Enterococcus faecium]
MHPNAPQNVTGVLNDGSISLSWDAVPKAQAYVINYSNANQSDPHDATMMGYSEKTSWTLAAEDVPTLEPGNKIYLYVQAYNVLGKGKDEIEKARYLHDGPFIGSAWSRSVVLIKK